MNEARDSISYLDVLNVASVFEGHDVLGAQSLPTMQRLADQYLGQFRVAQSLSNAHQIVVELAFGVAAHLHRLFFCGRYIGYDRLEIVEAAETEPNNPASEIGVVATKVLGRLLHYQDRLAEFFSRDGYG